jgi:hypothetical protein
MRTFEELRAEWHRLKRATEDESLIASDAADMGCSTEEYLSNAMENLVADAVAIVLIAFDGENNGWHEGWKRMLDQLAELFAPDRTLLCPGCNEAVGRLVPGDIVDAAGKPARVEYCTDCWDIVETGGGGASACDVTGHRDDRAERAARENAFTSHLRAALRRDGIGNHRVLSTDEYGWQTCRVVVKVAGQGYRITFAMHEEMGDWYIESAEPA